ncbi:MAG: 16S rRNA (adenine(1518)-N(6)/adenine(1519)-N(6))-dimethyltransferase RsmA [Alphaproteobacteria bacterium]|nr:16S rRNA (adenine(1518)-N(6)/adenine(1519)-N(6))-dimethyltransferase RsmA [Alphaproteobacteria bacterium]
MQPNTDLPPLRDLIKEHQLSAHKGLGQHFLLDLNLCHRIVASAGDLTGINVIEIGPGPGGLTRALLASNAASVTAIETDRRCIAALAGLVTHGQGRLRLIAGDGVTLNLAEITDKPRRIIANLPYNMGSKMLINWLHQIDDFVGLTLMFQREVALRIAAAPDSAHYGRLSVLAQSLCQCHYDFELAPSCFTPPPNVTSAIIHLTPHSPEIRAKLPPIALLERVTAAAFGQRRKMLRQSLGALGVDTKSLLEMAEIDGTRRAETLSIAEFHKLAKKLSHIHATS